MTGPLPRSHGPARVLALLTLAAGASSAPALAGAALQSPDGPRLEIEAPSRDFGHLFQGARIEHTFDLRSAGSEDLVIRDIKPTCGCTLAELGLVTPSGEEREYELGEPIAPGARVRLRAVFETSGLSGFQNKSISIHSNDPRGLDTVRIKAFVKSLLAAKPSKVDLGTLSTAESATAEVTVETTKAGPVLLSVEPLTLVDGLDAHLTPLDPDPEGRSERWRVQVSLPAGLPVGPFARDLGLLTDRVNLDAPSTGDELPLHGFSLKVLAEVVDAVTALPRFFSFGLVQPGESGSETVRVSLRDPDVQVGPIRWSLLGEDGGPFPFAHAFRVDVQPIDSASQWDVTVAFDALPAELEGKFSARLRLELGPYTLEPAVTGHHRTEPARPR